MGIQTVKRFYCPRCNFITYDENQIAMIEKHGGKCPACQDGEGGYWENKWEDGEHPIIKW